ncbi:MAG: hypothetical protein ACOH10_12585 [Rhodoglobus sp.]
MSITGPSFTLCLCDDGKHDPIDHLLWHDTAAEAEKSRIYYPPGACHLRHRIIVEAGEPADEPTDAPVGEIPPVCRTCHGSMRVPSSTRAGVTTPCPTCLGYGFLAVAS